MSEPYKNGELSDTELLGRLDNQPQALWVAPLTEKDRSMIVMALSRASVFGAGGESTVTATRDARGVLKVSRMDIPRPVSVIDAPLDQPA